MDPVMWIVLSPRRLVIVGLVLVLVDHFPDLVAEARYVAWRHWPWRAKLVERVPGVPEIVRSLLAHEGLSDDEIAARWRQTKARKGALLG